MNKILLGSMSSGRKHVLEKFGIAFDCLSPDVTEKSLSDSISLEEAINLVLYNSKIKMDAIFKNNFINNYSMIITSDTTVYCNNKLYEKTNDKEKAKKLLFELAGLQHAVITGVSISIKEDSGEFTTVELYDIS